MSIIAVSVLMIDSVQFTVEIEISMQIDLATVAVQSAPMWPADGPSSAGGPCVGVKFSTAASSAGQHGAQSFISAQL